MVGEEKEQKQSGLCFDVKSKTDQQKRSGQDSCQANFPHVATNASLCFSELATVFSVHGAAEKDGEQGREGEALFAGGLRSNLTRLQWLCRLQNKTSKRAKSKPSSWRGLHIHVKINYKPPNQRRTKQHPWQIDLAQFRFYIYYEIIKQEQLWPPSLSQQLSLPAPS